MIHADDPIHQYPPYTVTHAQKHTPDNGSGTEPEPGFQRKSLILTEGISIEKSTGTVGLVDFLTMLIDLKKKHLKKRLGTNYHHLPSFTLRS